MEKNIFEPVSLANIALKNRIVRSATDEHLATDAGLPTEALEKRFADEAEELGMGGLKGHRSVGGLRASIYNAMPLAGCEKLAEFMEAFYKIHK